MGKLMWIGMGVSGLLLGCSLTVEPNQLKIRVRVTSLSRGASAAKAFPCYFISASYAGNKRAPENADSCRISRSFTLGTTSNPVSWSQLQSGVSMTITAGADREIEVHGLDFPACQNLSAYTADAFNSFFKAGTVLPTGVYRLANTTATLSGASTTITLKVDPSYNPATATNLVGSCSRVTVVAGAFHSCALANGAAKCWGLNGNGQLGNNSTTNSSTPVNVQGFSSDASWLSDGGFHMCGIVSNAAKCWGLNSTGQLGNATTTSSSTPVDVFGLNASSGVTSISSSSAHTCAIVNGIGKCWGFNSSGQLGNGTNDNSTIPVNVSGSTVGISAISGGSAHTCAIISGGAWCWGLNMNGQLGNGLLNNSSLPVSVLNLGSSVTGIAAGRNGHTCAIHNGAAKCWGLNDKGQLGDNSTATTSNAVNVQGLSSGVTAIAAGERHSCAIVNGGVKCWGWNDKGQLGNNSISDSLVPVTVQGLDSNVTLLTTGMSHTCAVHGGKPKCWGFNLNGQLGDGTTTNSSVPVNVVGY